MEQTEIKLTITKKFIFFFILVFGLISIFFIIDYCYTNYFRAPSSEIDYRVPHKVYHHNLGVSFNGFDVWGHKKYKVCTDMNGFRSSCDKINVSNKQFDVAFIGDSMTEGIGLLHENTFVGMFAANHPKLKVANLGVASYNPTIYLTKIKWLLHNGFSFKHIYVFIDISDIQDESRYSINSNGVVISEDQTVKPDSLLYPLKEFVFKNFKLFYVGFGNLKRLIEPLTAKKQNLEDYSPKLSTEALPVRFPIGFWQRSEWTYNSNSTAYGTLGVDGSIKQAEKNMTELHKILNIWGISLSVGVYPWPTQLIEIKDSNNKINRQVSIWKKFCEKRCSNFINLFPKYKDLIAKNGLEYTYNSNFIPGDVHYNKAGNKLISDAIVYEKVK